MAKKRRHVLKAGPDGVIRSGIYARDVGRKRRRFLTNQEQTDQLQRIAEQPEPELIPWLNQMVRWGAEILRPHVAGPFALLAPDAPGTCYMADLGQGWQFFSPEGNAPEVVFDAFKLMDVCRLALIHAEPNGNPAYLAGAMHRIGRLHERILVREFEPLVATEQGRRKVAADTARSLNEAYTELHPQYQPEVDALQNSGSGLSYEKATAEVAQKFGVSQPTIKRNTVNKFPRHRSRHKKAE